MGFHPVRLYFISLIFRHSPHGFALLQKESKEIIEIAKKKKLLVVPGKNASELKDCLKLLGFVESRSAHI